MKNKMSNEPQEPQLNIGAVMPRFCFICGTKLMEVGLGWLQCESEQCGEVYLPFIDENNNQCLMHKRTPFSPTKEYRRWYTIKLRYGITKEEYENMLLKQNGGCAICGETKSGHKNTDEMVVDHCHKTKKVRGLLCNRCNTLLGLIDDSPTFMQNIAKYLNK